MSVICDIQRIFKHQYFRPVPAGTIRWINAEI